MGLAPFLSAKVDGLRITGIENRYDLAFDGAIVIGPRIAWAAELPEFSIVQVTNLSRGLRTAAHVIFGPEGAVQLWSASPPPAQPGDALQVRAFAWHEPDNVPTHETVFVSVGRKNLLMEFRRARTRVVPRDPSYIPLPPCTVQYERRLLTREPA